MTYLIEKLSMSASLLANFHSSIASHRRMEFGRMFAIEYALSRSYRLCRVKAGLGQGCGRRPEMALDRGR